VQGQRKEIN